MRCATVIRDTKIVCSLLLGERWKAEVFVLVVKHVISPLVVSTGCFEGSAEQEGTRLPNLELLSEHDRSWSLSFSVSGF